ncbi:class I SAM-dependent methyltransferase [Phaeobacter gallaeciensis]|uniref:class I SAM-dependent methyltransferase n=1 Tax=Phaeobacter gallaeciensis TaxID=60890 RepID=UPI00237F81B4|nr:class I SAM-dependent methyltransferase [Phaeobacter gallaeciensis]MDE4305759.1 class I SAM-dependent methyltransferase [Phaeobacter gallaeciensis]MDE4310107.1 class I SAM-dependent methyltransferase [Phaeobacter gallaeciensis]MDE4314494.1 class I SAM-dependent methyltransferase [Phaeobacter gallaeciensis]MDE4318966.1 class I SAM-dependent methyltransferase [Phaeobacter gallaeciensis]MDE4323429.1 class I SAM-dependent methyltransferase [Phaeobacter gallaeciensis]
MELKAVQSSYARWAPIYDRTFGAVTNAGRRRVVNYINRRGGSVLEVGVGTGLSLPHYGADLRVTGIDFSTEMLAKAENRVAEMGLANVAGLRQMDARDLDFPDASFDTVAAMHVLSVVPEPQKVMAEIARVLKPGGEVVISNHFKSTQGVLASLEKISAPFANVLGWHSDFEIGTILGEETLSLKEQESLPPFGMMTFLVLKKARQN